MWLIGALAGIFGLMVAVFGPSVLIDYELSFVRNYIRTRWFWPVLAVAMLAVALVNWGLGDLPTLGSKLSSVIFNAASGAAFGALILYVPELVRLRTFISAQRRAVDATTLIVLLINQYPSSPEMRLREFDKMIANGIVRVDALEVERLKDLLK